MVAPPVGPVLGLPFDLRASCGQRHRAAAGWGALDGASPARGAPIEAAGAAAARQGGLTSQARAKLRALSAEYPQEELDEATCRWDSSRRLGSGRYGAVYKGQLRDGAKVAIKAIDLAALLRNGERPEDCGFEREVRMLSKFRHPNLVTLLGWGQQGMMHYLVYEYLPGGDLFQRLYKSKLARGARTFFWHERLSICADTAAGISHMHGFAPKGFHRDIKSANILLDRNGGAKMADFGLSWSADEGPDTSGAGSAVGTPGYKCPVYAETGVFDEGSEMYSFGMVVLEVLTGLSPSAHSKQTPGSIVFPIAETIVPDQEHAADRCMRNLASVALWPPKLAWEVAAFALGAVECASGDGSARPRFAEALRLLRGMMECFPAPCQGPAAGAAASPGPPSPAPATPPAAAAASPARCPSAGPARGRRCAASLAPSGAAPPGSPRLWSPTPRRNASPAPPSATRLSTPRAAPWVARDAAADDGKDGVQKPPRTLLQSAAAWESPPPRLAGATLAMLCAPDPAKSPEGAATPRTPAAARQEACFQLEYVSSLSGCSEAARQHCLRLYPREGVAEVAPGGGCARVAVVGRHDQSEAFAAWVPNVGERKCISRRAFEVLWVPGDSSRAWLRSQSSNHLLVDGAEAVREALVPLRLGSEISLLSEHRALLHLRLALAGADGPREAAAPPATPSRHRRGAAAALQVGAGDSPVTPATCASPCFGIATPSLQTGLARAAAPAAAPPSPTRRLAASPLPQAPPRAGAAAEVLLELAGAPEGAHGCGPRRLGPLQLEAKPLLVGPRHQPEFFRNLLPFLPAGTAEGPPHLFCLAFLGEERWLFAVVPLLLIRGDSTQVTLDSDELAVIRPGDRIVVAEKAASPGGPRPKVSCSAGGICLRLTLA